MPDATSLQEWAEGHCEDTWSRVIQRENAGASPEVIWYHRGRHAAYKHLLALLSKYPAIGASPVTSGIPERRGGRPRENADDAYATFMDMTGNEWLGLVSSLAGGGALTPIEQQGFNRALTERGLIPE